MKRLLALAATASALAMAPAAHAALVINVSAPAGTFGNDDVTTVGAFSDVGFFATPAGYDLVSATISTAVVGGNPVTNIDFTSVLLNGVAFTLSPTGVVEFGALLDQPIGAAPNTLTINGIGGGDASYAGTLTFALRNEIPEPATWMMMLLGFGAVGFVMRRARSRTTTRVRYLPQLA